MGIFEFVKGTGQMVSATLAKAGETARAGEPGAAAANAHSGHPAPEAAEETSPGDITVSALEAKIKGAKVPHHDLSVKLVDAHTVKIYAVVEDAEAKSDLILLVGNTPGVTTVQDAIKVRATGSSHDVEAPAPRFYQVKSGDTLSAIAEAELGDASRFKELFNANRHVLSNPDQIDIGQTLKLPLT
jgi:nucleoid-associated protein YgaU